MKFNFCLLSILMMGINALSINRKDFLKYPGSFIVSKSVDSNKLKQDTSPIIDNAYLSNENSNPEVLENNNNDIYFYGPVNMTEKLTNTSDDGIETVNLNIRGDAPQGKLITVGLSTPITAARSGEL